MRLGQTPRDVHRAGGLHVEPGRHSHMGVAAMRRAAASLNPLLASARR